MRRAWKTFVRWGTTWAVVGLFACGGGGGGPDYSGTYYVAVGPDPKFTMVVVDSGGAVAFDLQGAEMPIQGTGTVNGGVMELTADVSGFGTFLFHLPFLGGGMEEFLGTWEVVGDPMTGTMTGTRQPWPTWDPNSGSPPTFAEADCIDLDKIGRVSKFRSGAGHDYSDDFESCRSMKHYFEPKSGIVFSTIRVYAPFGGTVVGSTEEWDGALWKGTAIGIRPDGYPAFHMVLFHVDLHTPLAVGDHVTVGQELGTSEKLNGTALDIAFGVHTPAGFRLVSYFEVMTNTLFQDYVLRGMVAPEEAIISEAARDADPLTCDGQQFLGSGALVNWVTLN